MVMAGNSLSGLYRGPHTANLGLGGALGLASTKGPMDRYAGEDESWTGWMKSKGGKKNNVAMSALTLLAFLFFLNILQNCMQEHMDMDKGKNKGYNLYPNRYNQTQSVIYINRGRRRDDDDDNTLFDETEESGSLSSSMERGDRGDLIDLGNYNIERMGPMGNEKNVKKRKFNNKKKQDSDKKDKVFQKINTVEKTKN